MFYINLDFNDLQDYLNLDVVAKEEAQAAAADLTSVTRAKIVELASQRLHTRRGMYIDALSYFQVDESTWVISLDAKVRWIDDGLPEHSMLESLLSSKKAKRAKDGSRYISVPFQHNKAKQLLTPAQQSLLATIKKALSSVGATPNGLETDREGVPKLGLIRSVDIEKAPISTGALKIGAGPRGHVAQGPTGIPLLRGVRVFQKELPNGKVGRFVMTFRTASDKQAQGRRWHHPGTPPMNLMDEGEKWAAEQWEKMTPAIIDRIRKRLK